MIQPGRKYASSSSKYRYSINGQEKDLELNENITTALYWEYDSRIGRRWNLDPRPVNGVSSYSSFNNNPIYNVDLAGDTSVNSAGGAQSVNIDESINSLEFYQPNTNYTISGTSIPVPVDPGQLRSFSNSLGTFKARWTTDENGRAVLTGYLNDNGETVNQAATAFEKARKINDLLPVNLFLNWAASNYQESQEDPVNWGVSFSTNLLLAGTITLMEPVPYSVGYNPSLVTKESMSALGTLTFKENLAFGLGTHLNSFSEAKNFMNYRKFTTGPFKPNEILSAIQNPNNNLNFNLQGFTKWKYLKYNNNPTAPSPALNNITNWELHTIYNTPGALNRTTFYNFINGSYKIVGKPF